MADRLEDRTSSGSIVDPGKHRPSSEIIQEFLLYSVRWLMLVLFMISSIANSSVYLTWSPISDKAIIFWDGINIAYINLFTAMFQIFYIPGTAMSLYFCQKYNLRMVMLAGGSLTVTGCFLRWLGGYLREDSDLNVNSSYALVLFGTIFVALGQPFYLNMSSKLASAWFSLDERDFSTTICSLANPLGKALGSAMSPLFIERSFVDRDGYYISEHTYFTDHGAQTYTPKIFGVSNLLFTQFIIALIAFGFVGLVFRSRPPTPPTLSASRDSSSSVQFTTNKSLGGIGFIYKEFCKLVSNREYIKLLLGFSIAQGSTNALLGLLNQLPTGFNNEQIGFTGFALILAGFAGSSVAGVILDKTKKYATVLKCFYVMAIVMWIVFASSIRLGNFAVFIIFAGFLGLVLLPIMPSTIVNACENSFPIPDDIIVSVLYISANLLAVCLTFIGQALLQSSPDSAGPSLLFPWGIWSILVLSIGCIPVYYYVGTYNRLTTDLSAKLIDNFNQQPLPSPLPLTIQYPSSSNSLNSMYNYSTAEPSLTAGSNHQQYAAPSRPSPTPGTTSPATAAMAMAMAMASGSSGGQKFPPPPMHQRSSTSDSATSSFSPETYSPLPVLATGDSNAVVFRTGNYC